MPRTAKSPKPEAQTLPAPLLHRAPVLLLTGLHAQADELCARIAQQLVGRRVLGHTVRAETLPASPARRPRQVRQWLRKYQPALVVCLGTVVGTSTFLLERAALNELNPETPGPVVPQGPTAYLSSLPLQAMQHGLHQVGLAAEVAPAATSEHSNRTLYTVLHELGRHPTHPGALPRGGLLQVPQSSDPGSTVPLHVMAEGVRQALRYALWVLQNSPSALSHTPSLAAVHRIP